MEPARTLAALLLAAGGGERDGLPVRCLLDSIGEATIFVPDSAEPPGPVVLPLEGLTLEGKFPDGRRALALPLAVDDAHALELVSDPGAPAAPLAPEVARSIRWLRGEREFTPAQITAFRRFPETVARSGRRGVRIANAAVVSFTLDRNGRDGVLTFVFEPAPSASVATPPVTLVDESEPTAPLRGAASADAVAFALPDRLGDERVTARFAPPPDGEAPLLVAIDLVESGGRDRLIVPDLVFAAHASVRYVPLAPAPVIPLAELAQRDGAAATVLLRGGACALVGPDADAFAFTAGTAVAPTATTALERSFAVARAGIATLACDAARRGARCWLVQPSALWERPLQFNRGAVAEPANPWVHSIELGDETRRALVLRPGGEVRFPCAGLDAGALELELATAVLEPGPFEARPLALEVALARGATEERVALAEAPIAGGARAWSDARWTPLRRALAAAPDANAIVLRCPLPEEAPISAQLDALLVAEPRLVTSRAPRPRNLLIYLVDTLRADHVSCIDPRLPTTPNFDALARDGVVFRRAYSGAPWTRPAVATLFTGVLPEMHGVTFGTALPTRFDTLAERMRRAGFETAAFAVNGHVHAAGLAFEQGFDRFVAAQPPAGEPPRAAALNDSVLPWLAERRDRPFFLYVHTLDPHDPYAPPEETAGRFGSQPEVGRVGSRDTRAAALAGLLPLTDRELAQVRSLYAEDVLANDLAFGALVARLKELGLYDDTVIVVMADHGEELQDHGRFGHVGRLWDEVMHVPVVIKLAGAERPHGRVVDAPIRTIDLLPTFVELFGLGCEGGFLGRSIAPLWRNEELEPLPVVAEDGALTAIAAEGWKLVVREGEAKTTETVALFDLASDPREAADRKADRPEIVERLQKLLASFRADARRRGFAPAEVTPFQANEADRKRLDALGYAQDR